MDVDCNINVKLNYKIFVKFHNLKNYNSHLILQELGKSNLKINVIPDGLEKYMSEYIINNKLSFIDSFQFLSSSLDSLVKNLWNDDIKYSSLEFDFKKFKEKLPTKVKLYSSLAGKKLVTEYDHVLKVWNKLEIKTMKDYHDLYVTFHC